MKHTGVYLYGEDKKIENCNKCHKFDIFLPYKSYFISTTITASAIDSLPSDLITCG